MPRRTGSSRPSHGGKVDYALGAAFLAGLSVGVWDRDGLQTMRQESGDVFAPKMSAKTAEELYRGWCKAVRHARHWLMVMGRT